MEVLSNSWAEVPAFTDTSSDVFNFLSFDGDNIVPADDNSSHSINSPLADSQWMDFSEDDSATSVSSPSQESFLTELPFDQPKQGTTINLSLEKNTNLGFTGAILAVQTPDNEIKNSEALLAIPTFQSDTEHEQNQSIGSNNLKKIKNSHNTPKKRITKKRARPNDQPADVSRVKLSREDLLRISSKELEDLAARVSEESPLSVDEQREVKRQRRLIKNREYAQASRVKKKSYLSDLENRFNEIENENYDLKLQIQSLNSKVSILTNENNQLKAKINTLEIDNSSDITIDTSAYDPTSKSGSVSDFLANVFTVENTPSLITTKLTQVQAGVCLFILLFSFAIFFHPTGLLSPPSISPTQYGSDFGEGYNTFNLRRLSGFMFGEEEATTCSNNKLHFGTPKKHLINWGLEPVTATSKSSVAAVEVPTKTLTIDDVVHFDAAKMNCLNDTFITTTPSIPILS